MRKEKIGKFSNKNILQKLILRKNKKIIIKSDQIEFKGHYMEPPQKGYFMIKLIDWYENRAVINLYMLNIEASKRIKQK